MPLTRISVPEHLSVERARALADAVHDGLVACCDVAVQNRFQLLSRFGAGQMLLDPTFPNLERSADACVIEISLLRGRSDAQKRALYRRIAASAVAAGFRADDVLVSLTENTLVDWSLGRGESYDAHPPAAV